MEVCNWIKERRIRMHLFIPHTFYMHKDLMTSMQSDTDTMYFHAMTLKILSKKRNLQHRHLIQSRHLSYRYLKKIVRTIKIHLGHCPTKLYQGKKKGKSKGKRLNTGNSWSNPKVLKKVSKKHQNMIIGQVIDIVKNSNFLSKMISGGGKFVKINLNGRGCRSHKFVNKGFKRKAMSYG
jgi:hypothetical protein